MVRIAPLAESLPAFLETQRPSQAFVLVDEHTRRFCYPLLKPLLGPHRLIGIRSGEAHKTLATAGHVWAELTRHRADRHALLLNLGGGVIGDLGGFCAATYKRGIRFAQLPTTLLAQVDASVGGKLGLDFEGLKNHIGVFRVPDAVLIDTAFLNTLPEAQLRSGFAEVIKHCLIGDAARWEGIRRRDLHEQPWPELVAHSVAFKQKITEADPTERGLRKILNFGHTLGHAIETHLLPTPRRLLHGEAVAAGMVAEAWLSYQRGSLPAGALEQIEAFVFSVFGKAGLSPADVPAVIKLTAQDKKNRNGRVLFSLLDGIGNCGFDTAVSSAAMQKALAYYLG